MRRLSLVCSLAGSLLLASLAFTQPAFADQTLTGVNITGAEGNFYLPGQCAYLGDGGCSTATSGFKIVGGYPHNTLCQSEDVLLGSPYPVPSPCRIDYYNGTSFVPGTGWITVMDDKTPPGPATCGLFQVKLVVDATHPALIQFADNARTWKLDSLKLTAYNGAVTPDGGYRWYLLGSFSGTNVNNANERLTLTITYGNVLSTATCQSGFPLSNLTFAFGGTGQVVTTS